MTHVHIDTAHTSYKEKKYPDVTKALLAAARSDSLETVEFIFKQFLASRQKQPTFESELSKILNEAISDGLSGIFKVITSSCILHEL